MLFKEFEVGARTYKLAMNTRSVIELEKKMGCNPIAVFGDGDRVPTVTDMINILSAALQRFEHGLTQNDAISIFDTWLDEGHNIAEFIPVILDVYKVSGLISSENEEAAKN